MSLTPRAIINSNNESIKVICRLRPDLEISSQNNFKPCIEVFDTENKLRINLENQNEIQQEFYFTFDKIFSTNTDQEEIFNYCAKPIFESVLKGQNATILCYGQTSSGKTYTMEGVISSQNKDLYGLTPRMIDYIFDCLKLYENECEYSIKCSFIEIYNEKIQDLIDPKKSNLLIKDDKAKGIWVQEASEIYVSSPDELLEIFKLGIRNRSIAATKMNERSSRSHSIFILTLLQKNKISENIKLSKLYFVDLAGSEKISKTAASGSVLEEAKNINKSLMCLGMVINSLTVGISRGHIPYRDSKLTRILQESLGGNSKTTLIVTCSVNPFNDKESLSTLRFGSRVKTIKNKPIINDVKSLKELQNKVSEYEIIIEELQNKICGCENKIEELQLKLGHNNGNITEWVNIFTNLEKKNEDLKFINNNLEEEISIRNIELYELNDKFYFKNFQYKLLKMKFEEIKLKIKNEIKILLDINQNMFIYSSNILNEISLVKNKAVSQGLFLSEEYNVSEQYRIRIENVENFVGMIEDKSIESYRSIMEINKSFGYDNDFSSNMEHSRAKSISMSSNFIMYKTEKYLNQIKLKNSEIDMLKKEISEKEIDFFKLKENEYLSKELLKIKKDNKILISELKKKETQMKIVNEKILEVEKKIKEK